MSDKIILPATNVRGLYIKTRKNHLALLAPGHTRPNTYINPYYLDIVLWNGGFGDFFAFTRVFEWMADTLPQIYGTLYYPKGMLDFAHYFFDERPHWKIESNEPCRDPKWEPEPGRAGMAPGLNGNKQYLTCHGVHPLDYGFALYANELPVPEGYNNYPEIDLLPDGLPDGLEPGKYAVLTPAAITESRTVPGHFWNPIVDYVKSLDLTPVILGRGAIAPGYFAKIATGMNMDGVVSLWDKTTIMEAAQIIQHAAVTIGLDNGLLHLAGCTTCPIVYGYNVTSVEKRRPRRRKGKIVDVFLTKEELGCSGCLTGIKGYPMHDFDYCLYKPVDNLPHPKCIDMLFSDGGRRWIEAIDKALGAE